MANARKNKLASISEEVWRGLVKLSASLPTQSPPTKLEEFAKDVGIHHVRFKPLISDAGLAKVGDSLEIIVNTEAPGVTLPVGTTASVGDGTWGKFQRSLRFTVAHEIAHAVFIRAAKQHDEVGLLEQHRPDVEEACKILARLMLLPRRILVRELGEKLFDVDVLNGIISAFHVSPEVFLRRFHLSDLGKEFTKLDGFIAFVIERDGRLCIKVAHVLNRMYAEEQFDRAFLKPTRFEYPGLSKLYRQSRWALEGMALNAARLDAKKDIEAVLRNTEAGQIDLRVGRGHGDFIPCNMAFRRIREHPLGFLVRVQVIGDVRKLD